MEPTTNELLLAGTILFFALVGFLGFIFNVFGFIWFLLTVKKEKQRGDRYLKVSADEWDILIETLSAKNCTTPAAALAKRLKEEYGDS